LNAVRDEKLTLGGNQFRTLMTRSIKKHFTNIAITLKLIGLIFIITCNRIRIDYEKVKFY